MQALPRQLRFHSSPRRTRPGGFTLLELLVVIAVIGILAGLLLPALSKAKTRAQSIACLNHHRQLILATFLYAGDSSDALPNNFGSDETLRTVAQGKYLNWVNNVMSWELDAQNTNRFLLMVGGLGPYLSGGTAVFRCPSDRAVSDLQREAGWTERARSISMNAMVGDAGEFSRSGANQNNPYHRQFFKFSHIPQPAQIFVFIEEHPDSINDGYFLNKLNEPEWYDLPASYHNGQCNLAFADGHLEQRNWRHDATRPLPRPDAARLPREIALSEREDFDWLMDRTTVGESRRPTY